DNYYWLYVNGNHIATETRPVGYTIAKTYDITKYLLPGKNVVSIKVQNDDGTEGVALSGEIKYKTYDNELNQLQTQIDSMESQINALSNDKSRLQTQADGLQLQVKNLTSSKDELTAQVSQLQIENLGLKNSIPELQAQLADATSRAESSRVLNIVLILGLVIAIAALIASLFYFSNKLKGRKPRLVEPEKRMPSEKMTVSDKEPSSLSIEKPAAPAPTFERGKTSTLAGK
ncbi:MAG: hypothetical protein PHG85_07505, partial [Candidatus Altiarchaeota archaeon]|nr:hypothetical protein [Candidatus Altiarchaeota archaeon]